MQEWDQGTHSIPGHSNRAREGHVTQAKPMKILLWTFTEAFEKEASPFLW